MNSWNRSISKRLLKDSGRSGILALWMGPLLGVVALAGAIPLGSVLAFYLEIGAIGLWIGLASGLCVSALILSTRLWYQLKRV